MNVELKIFGRTPEGAITADNGTKQAVPAVAGALFRMHPWVTQHLAVTMRSFGIQRAIMTMEFAGVVPVTSIAFEGIPGITLPPAVKTMQPKIVRILRDMFECFGVQMVQIKLTDQELTEVQAYWHHLETGEPLQTPTVQPAPDSELAGFQRVPLHLDTDPTAQAPIQLMPAPAATPEPA